MGFLLFLTENFDDPVQGTDGQPVRIGSVHVKRGELFGRLGVLGAPGDTRWKEEMNRAAYAIVIVASSVFVMAQSTLLAQQQVPPHAMLSTETQSASDAPIGARDVIAIKEVHDPSLS